MSPDPAPRVVWITGAGKGIGRALALELAGAGWVVAASSRTESDLQEVVGTAAASGGRIVAVQVDVADISAVRRVVRDIEKEVGPIALAVLNAGNHIPTDAARFELTAFRNLIEINFMGTVNCLDALLPSLRQRQSGQIAVMASLAGYRGLPGAAAYGASKAALINMSEALRPELELLGIRLCLINPGFVATPLTDRNDFRMPFLITAEDAARRIHRGLLTGQWEIAFPTPFAMIMKALRILPASLFFMLARRLIRKT